MQVSKYVEREVGREMSWAMALVAGAGKLFWGPVASQLRGVACFRRHDFERACWHGLVDAGLSLLKR